MTRRYFTESCKNITAPATISDGNTDDSDPSVFHRELQNNYSPCHNHRQQYRRILTHWYFTESCKNITAPATITYRYTDGYTDAFTDGWCTFQCARLSKCLVGWHSYRWMRQIQCARALTHRYQRICRRTSKNLEGFSKFWCEFQKIPTEIIDKI
jgi:hypothetical protein